MAYALEGLAHANKLVVRLLGKIEASLDLVRTGEGPDAKEAH